MWVNIILAEGEEKRSILGMFYHVPGMEGEKSKELLSRVVARSGGRRGLNHRPHISLGSRAAGGRLGSAGSPDS